MHESEPPRRWVRSALASAVVLLALTIPQPAQAATCTTTLRGIPTKPLPLLDDNHLRAVSARTPTDLWAVGGHSGKSSLILHSDGTTWSVAANPGSYKTSDLRGVASFSATDAWAVGEWDGYSPYFLFQHWDGTQWSYDSAATKGTLRAVDGSSGSDVWAVGDTESSTAMQPAAQHFDGSTWTSVPTAGDQPLGELNGVSSVSSSNVWAVGDGPNGALIQHWNGSTWSSRTDPSGDAMAKLLGISATSGSNVWAVGSLGAGGSTLIEHWNGTAWSVVASPSPGTAGNVLMSVSATSAKDVWAAGSSTSGGVKKPLLLHWNGTSWRKVGGSALPQASGFDGIASTGAGRAVAVGDVVDATSGIDRTLAAGSTLAGASVQTSPNVDRTKGPVFRGVDAYSDTEAWALGTNSQPVAEHWNGSSWTATTVPGAFGEVDDAHVISPNDVWAVGSSIPSGSGWQPRVMHWDGTRWTIAATHINFPTPFPTLTAVDAVSSSDVWAVGDIGHALVLHWDGSTWARVHSPLFSSASRLEGVLALGTNNVWAVGESASPLIHWNGTSWSNVTVPAGVSSLYGIQSIPGGGFWAVGDGTNGQALILRKTGGQLTIVPGAPPADSGLLVDVAVISSTDAWAVGYQRVLGNFEPLVLRWDGSSWSSQAFSPNNGGDFEGIGASPSGRIWAGGLITPPLYQACGV